jgi:hypothetical protein
MEKKLRLAESLNPFLKKYLGKLEAENEQMKTDPNTTVGQLIPQMRQAIDQNKRLSVLAAALLEAQGGSVTLTKAALESFESKVLNIKWNLPEGVEDAKTAEEFIFTYEAKEQEEVTAPQVVVSPDGASVEIVPNDDETTVNTEDEPPVTEEVTPLPTADEVTI